MKHWNAARTGHMDEHVNRKTFLKKYNYRLKNFEKLLERFRFSFILNQNLYIHYFIAHQRHEASYCHLKSIFLFWANFTFCMFWNYCFLLFLLFLFSFKSKSQTYCCLWLIQFCTLDLFYYLLGKLRS